MLDVDLFKCESDPTAPSKFFFVVSCRAAVMGRVLVHIYVLLNGACQETFAVHIIP